MHMPDVLCSAKQAAAVTFPENGRAPPAASSIPPVLPSLPLRVHALGQQLLLRLGQWLEKLDHRFGTSFLQLLNLVPFFDVGGSGERDIQD